MTHLTIRRRWAFFGITLAPCAFAAGMWWHHTAGNGAPVEDAALLAVAVAESTAMAESRGAGSDAVDELTIDVTAADATTSLVAVRTPGYAATTAPSGPLHVGYSARAFTPTNDFVLEYERAPSAGYRRCAPRRREAARDGSLRADCLSRRRRRSNW